MSPKRLLRELVKLRFEVLGKELDYTTYKGRTLYVGFEEENSFEGSDWFVAHVLNPVQKEFDYSRYGLSLRPDYGHYVNRIVCDLGAVNKKWRAEKKP